MPFLTQKQADNKGEESGRENEKEEEVNSWRPGFYLCLLLKLVIPCFYATSSRLQSYTIGEPWRTLGYRPEEVCKDVEALTPGFYAVKSRPARAVVSLRN